MAQNGNDLNNLFQRSTISSTSEDADEYFDEAEYSLQYLLELTTKENSGGNKSEGDSGRNDLNNQFQQLHLDPRLQRFNQKRNAIREIDKHDLLEIPGEINVKCYNDLRTLLGSRSALLKSTICDRPQNKTYKSPRDLVQMLVHNRDMNPKTIKKLFEKQFEIKWNTNTGDPDQFSFYGFCKDVYKAGGNNVRMPQTRKAHVLSKLYHAQEKLHKIRHLSHKELCPPVYVYKHPKWTKWKWDKRRGVNRFVEDQNHADIEWITNKKMKKYIQQHSISSVDPNKKEGHLYWAVLEEDDIEEDDIEEHGIEKDDIEQYNNEESPKEDESSEEWETEYFDHIFNKSDEDDEDDVYEYQYHETCDKEDFTDDLGETQVYVGQAGQGIRNRWVEHTSSHCKNMELSRNVMYNMMNYDPETLKERQLVDLRFLLHKANNLEGDNSGLFLMHLYRDKTLSESESIDIKGVEMDGWTLEPLNMLYGMNCKSGNKS